MPAPSRIVDDLFTEFQESGIKAESAGCADDNFLKIGMQRIDQDSQSLS